MSFEALKALREHVRCLESHWHERVLEFSGILVAACEEPGSCPLCTGAMGVQKTFVHTGKTIEHGTIQIRETVHVCEAKCCHPSGALVTRRALSVTRVLIPERTIGYDVMVSIGIQRFLDYRQREEIRDDLLHSHGVDLSSGEVSDLSRLFLRYLETLHEIHTEAIRDVLSSDGGYPLQVDASGENGRGTLLVALAGWRRWVLDAWKIPTECTEVIHPALRSVVERFGIPCAVLRDLGKAMIPAVNALLEERDEDIHVLSCHQHFLADVGKDLLDPSHGELRGLFRHHKIRPNLGALARDLGRRIGDEITAGRKEVGVWQQALHEGHVVPDSRAGYATVRALSQ